MDGTSHRPAVALLTFAVVTAGCVQGPMPEVPEPTAAPEDASPRQAPIAEANLTIEVLDVGQADAIVVHLPGATMVVDTADRHRASYGRLLDHLAADGIDRLAALALTHPDADHAGGCDEVLAQVEVEQIVHPGRDKDTATWHDCQTAIRAEGAPVLTDATLDPGDAIELTENATVRVVWLDAHAEDANEASLVLRLDHGGASALLTGDIGCGTEDAILDRGVAVDVDLVQVAHHGSGGSTCRGWLAATTPTIGVVSVGQGNPYGHPHPDTLDRLRDQGTAVYRTDEHGTVTATTNGTAWDVSTRHGAPRQEMATGDDASDTNTSSPPPVTVLEVHADAPGNDREALDQEWVRIGNPTNASVDLSGWQIEDEAGHAYPFPWNTTIAAGADLTVHTGHGRDNATDLFWDRDQPVWNNDGDTASLYAPEGELVDEHTYP